jgi:hypothetical protein
MSAETVIPAKAGIQSAVVAMEQELEPRLRGDDGEVVESMHSAWQGSILRQSD